MGVVENISEFGERLEQLLKDCKITKKGLADGLGVSPSTVTQYFEADAPGIDTIRRICKACGIKTYQFIAFTETDIPVKAWSNFERIMSLEEIDKNFVLEGINNTLRFVALQFISENVMYLDDLR